MQTRRDYLASKGLAIAGARGKFSNAAKEELTRAYASGMTFSDDVSIKPARPAKPTGEAKPVPASPTETPYVSPSDYRFPEGEYHLTDAAGKAVKTAGMRNVCDTCRLSFVNHICNSPVLFGSPVRIVRN